jgi:uncharacterized protein YegP (UPF0339 family)
MYKVKFFKKKSFWGKTNWYWKVTAKNGNIIGRSTEGYRNKQDCIRNAKVLGLSLFYKKNHEFES